MSAPAVSPVQTFPRQEAMEQTAVQEAPRRSRRWIRRILALIILVLAFDYGISFLLESGWLNKRFTRRLEAAFGRPVEVSHYDFSLIQGPRLEADYITVGEDPRFGSEYFLRADQLSVGLRWTALLRGRIELGTLSFTRPRLNLVRLADGQWNLEAWLPQPRGDQRAIMGPALPRAALRLDRIEVSDGRVDFKQGADKLPFAFVDVEGRVEQTGQGSWRVDLDAQPFRAAVVVQQAGVLHLSGVAGGTSSRLRPASLQLDWSNASLSDLLRLVRGNDSGMRGFFASQVEAHTRGDDWTFSFRSQLRRLHRWDMPERPDDPAANLDFDANWNPATSRVELSKVTVEMPRSNLEASGGFMWLPSENPGLRAIEDARLHVSSSSIQLPDLLAWYRAFHANVADQIALRGSLGMDLTLDGWPPHLQRGMIATDGLEFTGGSTLAPIRMGKASLQILPQSILLPPVNLAVGRASGEFRLQGALDRGSPHISSWKLDGRTDAVETLFAASSALGYALPTGWSLDGPAEIHLRWKGTPRPVLRRPEGSVTLTGMKVRTPFLNREITHVNAAVNLGAQNWKVQIASADAFGTTWQGTVQRFDTGADVRFALHAGQLSGATMDSWLNPQRRESLLDRVFPFLATPEQPLPVPGWLHGSGALTVDEFRLAPLMLRELRAEARVAGRNLELSDAQGEFYGGTIAGSIALDLTAQPTYRVKAAFRKVDLSQLAAHTYSFSNLVGGTASGSLAISAQGVGREALLRSVGCRGDAQVQNAEYKGIDLAASLHAGARRPGTTSFHQAQAEFTCAEGRVNVSRLKLISAHQELDASGWVDAQRAIDFKVQALPEDAPGDSPGTGLSNGTFLLTGPLQSPELVRALHPSPPR